ncbi:hypothetical protein FGO68_gene17170 [Halteria grandinella]|uniref:Uncharacterized protein n=1 Tax=Halteria grandinella TaxID=5974 RepID=A0A8J8T7K9_HALGN|nr:hypothetical protein FGO68_gene17170 [Halteria grandinella]
MNPTIQNNYREDALKCQDDLTFHYDDLKINVKECLPQSQIRSNTYENVLMELFHWSLFLNLSNWYSSGYSMVGMDEHTMQQSEILDHFLSLEDYTN